MAETNEHQAAFIQAPLMTADDAPLDPSDKPTESAEQFFCELDADDSPFYREEDYTLHTARGPWSLRLCSVPMERIQEDLEALRPRRPTLRDRAGRQIIDDQRLMDLSPSYRQAMARYNLEVAYSYILHGTKGLQLKMGGKVVWSADGYVRDRQAARVALEKMGLGEPQFLDWYQRIRTLSGVVQEESDADFLPESDVS